MGFIQNNDNNNNTYSKTRILALILRLIECRKYILSAGEKATNALLHLYFNAFISMLCYMLFVIRSDDDNHYENCVGLFSCKKYFWIIIIVFSVHSRYHCSHVKFFIRFVCTLYTMKEL